MSELFPPSPSDPSSDPSSDPVSSSSASSSGGGAFDRGTISITTSGDLVAALPALLGFVPAESVLAVAVTRRGGRLALREVMRADLPDGVDDAEGVANCAVARFARPDVAGLHLVIVTDQPGQGGAVPAAEVENLLRGRLVRAGIEVISSVWAPRVAAGAPWCCYDPCGCSGVVSDPGASVTAATVAAVTGRVVHRSREEAAQALAPDPDAGGAHRRARLDQRYAAADADRRRHPGRAVREDLAALARGAAAAAAGQPLEEELLAQVLVALTDPQVRDVCLGWAAGSNPDVPAESAAALWSVLTRAAPAPEVAEPATLLAFATLRTGGGAALNVALERATRADPEHRLSRLLVAMLVRGLGPEQIEAVLLRGVEATEQAQRTG